MKIKIFAKDVYIQIPDNMFLTADVYEQFIAIWHTDINGESNKAVLNDVQAVREYMLDLRNNFADFLYKYTYLNLCAKEKELLIFWTGLLIDIAVNVIEAKCNKSEKKCLVPFILNDGFAKFALNNFIDRDILQSYKALYDEYSSDEFQFKTLYCIERYAYEKPVYQISDVMLLKDRVITAGLMAEILGFETVFLCGEINERLLRSYYPQCRAVQLKNYQLADEANSQLYTKYIDFIAKYVDIIMVYGTDKSSTVIINSYRQANHNGKIFWKMDMNRQFLYNILNVNDASNKLNMTMLDRCIEKCDVVTVESRGLQSVMNKFFNGRINILYNSYFMDSLHFGTMDISFAKKKNIILSVARFGTYQKNTELLLTGFAKAGLNDWELRLVGSIEEKFQREIDKIILPSNIKFIGRITDKQRLAEEYAAAKVFLLSSRLESSANVFAEAAAAGCYIVTTNVDGAENAVADGRCGTIIYDNNADILAAELERVCNDDARLAKGCEFALKWGKTENISQRNIAKLNELFKCRGIL